MTINFIRQFRRQRTELQQKDKSWFNRSLVVVTLSVLVTLSAVAVQWWYGGQLSQVQARQTQLAAQLDSQSGQESTYLILNAQLVALTQLLEERQYKQQAIEFFSDYFGNGVVVEEMSYLGTSTPPLLSLRLRAPDVFVFENLLTQLENEDLQAEYPNLSTSEVNRGNNGAYTLQIEVGLERN